MSDEGITRGVVFDDHECPECGHNVFDIDLVRNEVVCEDCGLVDEHIMQGPKPKPVRSKVRGCMPWFVQKPDFDADFVGRWV
jgi:hypothetical protein